MNEIVKNLVAVSLLALSLSQPAMAKTGIDPNNDNPYNEDVTLSSWRGRIANSHSPVIEQRFSDWILNPENQEKVKKNPNQVAVQMSLIEAVRYVELWNGSVDKGFTKSKNFRTAFCQFGKRHGIIDVAEDMTREEIQKQSNDWSRCDGSFQPDLTNIKRGLERYQWDDPGLQYLKRID